MQRGGIQRASKGSESLIRHNDAVCMTRNANGEQNCESWGGSEHTKSRLNLTEVLFGLWVSREPLRSGLLTDFPAKNRNLELYRVCRRAIEKE